VYANPLFFACVLADLSSLTCWVGLLLVLLLVDVGILYIYSPSRLPPNLYRAIVSPAFLDSDACPTL